MRRLAPRPPAPGWAFVELLALTGFAVTQPVLHVFEDGANIFVLRRPGVINLVLFTLVVALVPALALWFVELAAGLMHARLRGVVHLVSIAFLGGVIAVNAVKRLTSLAPKPTLALAVVAGVTLTLVVARFGPVRSWLRWLALAVPVIVGLFLFASPVSQVFGDDPGAAKGVRVDNPAPVVMVVFDEFPTASLLDENGQIDRELFPNFAALAGDATWYRNATTVAQETTAAVPAIVTGNLPSDANKLAVAASYPHNLFTLLGSRYRMNVREVVTQLCPRHLCPGSASRPERGALSALLDEAAGIWRHIASPRRSDPLLAGGNFFELDLDAPLKLQAFTQSIQASEQPRLDYLHVLFPHQPWNFLPDGTRYQAPFPAGYQFFTWFDDALAAQARARHLQQVRYTDALLGELLDRLRELGTYEKSLVVVTADHGVAFTKGSSYRGVTTNNFHEIMWVPMLVKAPHQDAAEVSDSRVLSIDVLPTIADRLGIDLPWAVDGKPAATGSPPARDDRRVLESRLSSLEPKRGRYLHFDGRAGHEALLRSGVPASLGDPALRPFRREPFGDLVGARVDQFGAGPASSFSVELDKPERFQHVEPARDPPVFVSGSVMTDRPITVAVSINGVIGDWSNAYLRTFREPNDLPPGVRPRQFWTLIPQSLLRPGANEVRVFLIGGPPGARTLSSLPLLQTTGELTVSPASSRFGRLVTVTGDRFQPGETVRVRYRTLQPTPAPRAIDICRAVAKPDGSFTCKGEVQVAGGPYGDHPVVALGLRSSIRAQALFKVSL